MNTPIRRLSVVVLLMFAALMVQVTLVQYGRADALNNKEFNTRSVYREYGRDRGPIVVAGNEIAFSEPVDDAFGYQRVYTDGPAYAPITGYFSVVFQASGMEKAENDVLNGSDTSLLLSRIRTLFTGGQQRGGTVELTVDPAVQEAALEAFGDQRGAAVAIEPATGRILALVSTPSFDPNVLAGHDTVAVNEAYQELIDDPDRPLINRAIGGDQYPPGSTFKLIDLAMILESGDYGPDSVVPAPTELDLPGTSATIHNPGGSVCGSGGEATLMYSLQVSCNTPFANLAMEFGAEALTEQAEAFGFGRDLTIPLKVTGSRLGDPQNDAQLAMTAIGQFDVRVTPLQMAMVSAAIANDGVLMKPYLVQTERGPDLRVTSSTEPVEFSRPVSPETAATMTEMMVNVVDNGTGAPARIAGVDVAGKTGTAQTGNEENQHAWFTSFAPADDPQVAVAVVVENGGDLAGEATGSKVAAPIARAMMEAVIGE
ncbi:MULTISPECIES: penicillin-binding protein 2 [unclassified Pseudactinotalea]|uniref:peptidoglycan D,D-transpeptidase FtsI family protein n=1 Tax=unclassified Pseudactinotalea TaxID=2649176 RepID=UPI00128C306F|nr:MULTISPECIES: penicillin-binding transpeptidase domain-containing protein [unclassified Pseudactinotalea]MPV49187.1 penicillin-binding protein 2 [Pseudactinotalea sp. HY160]QGH68142.1 penicillin-binding protein 2 [Pseudactinotalea sp. HY158]